MQDKISIAEQEGMTFGERCAQAMNYMDATWDYVQAIATTSLTAQHEHALSRRKVEEEATRSVAGKELLALADVFDAFYRGAADLDQKYMQQVWQGALKRCKELFGVDATEFALKQTDRLRTGN